MVTRAYSWCLAALLFVGVVVHISYCAPVDRQKEASYRKQAIRDAYSGSYALCLVAAIISAEVEARQRQERERDKDKSMPHCDGRFNKFADFSLVIFKGVLIVGGVFTGNVPARR
jgi:hypothetical protein